jgi:hypothetical protein
MPDKEERATARKAKQALRQGKQPSTAAGEFVREEIQHVRAGKHGARSAKQAIAIGLSKARRAGIPLKPPRAANATPQTRTAAARAYEVGEGKRKPRGASPRRARAVRHALERESHATVSHAALAAQARSASARRNHADRVRAAREAAATKRATTRARAARRAARTRRGRVRAR